MYIGLTMASQLWLFGVSILLVLILTPFAIRLARGLNFLDYPLGHKSHRQPTPLLGGATIFAALSISLLVALVLGWLELSRILFGYYLCSLTIVLIGLTDDRWGLSPARKFFGQLATALLFLSFYDPGLTSLGFPLGFFLILFWIVGLINALNFLDNMDGLCSGITLVASLSFAVLALLEGQALLLVISLCLAGGFLAFLKFNINPARIFLGDAGSMLSGFSLAVMGLLFVSEIRTQYAILAPLLILSYPIFDISFVTFTRLKQGKKFYQGGQDHSSHRLVFLGMNSKKAVWGILVISMILAASGILTFYFFNSPVKILIPLTLTFALTLFGIHLHRNFLNFREKLFLIGLDILVVNLAFMLLNRFDLESILGLWNQAGLAIDSSTLGILLNFFWINLFAVAGLYEFYWGMLVREELKAVIKTVLGGGLLLFLFGGRHVLASNQGWALITLYILSILAGVTLLRTLLIYLQRRLTLTGRMLHPAVIVGTEDNARQTWDCLQNQSGPGLKVVGFIDENHSARERNLPIPILGKVEDLEETLKKNRVREVLIAVEPTWQGSLKEIVEGARNIEVNFRVKSNLLPRVRGLKLAPLYGNSFYKVYPSQMRTWEWGIKRIQDIAYSILLLALATPLLLLLVLKNGLWKGEYPLEAVAILGKNGKIIKLRQFNSRHKSASWHKLPLLLYVLKGDLSLIGPSWVKIETGEDPALLSQMYEDKLKVRPGLLTPRLTANGGQPEAGLDQTDLEYVERMSFTSDLAVLAKSIARPISKAVF